MELIIELLFNNNIPFDRATVSALWAVSKWTQKRITRAFSAPPVDCGVILGQKHGVHLEFGQSYVWYERGIQKQSLQMTSSASAGCPLWKFSYTNGSVDYYIVSALGDDYVMPECWANAGIFENCVVISTMRSRGTTHYIFRATMQDPPLFEYSGPLHVHRIQHAEYVECNRDDFKTFDKMLAVLGR